MSQATVDLVGAMNAQGLVDRLDHQAQANENLDVQVAQGLPPYVEMARQGQGWSVMNTSALAALVVRPSTTSQVTLWNGETSGGKSYIMDRAFIHNLVAVANSGFGIWLCLHKDMAAITDGGFAVRGNTGNGYSGAAKFAVAQTVIADGWFPWSNSIRTVTVTVPGGQVEVLIEGRLIVPPGRGISLQVVADTTAVTTTAGFSWYEKKLTLLSP